MLTVTIISCGEVDDPLPAGTIVDSEGLNIELEWSSGGSVSDATSDADLELILLINGTTVDASEGSSFESVRLSKLLADGDYDVAIEVFEISKSVDFTLYVEGNKSKTRLEYEGSFSSSDEGSEFPDFVTITKSGETYTVKR